MINLSFRVYDSSKAVDKNTLYKIDKSDSIVFVEPHEATQEIVNIEFDLIDEQYGIYANEYKRPGVQKDGCKTTDVLACVVDIRKKQINSLVFDVKSNISAFSDDLSKEGAMITAIKEVRDFREQIHAEILHKETFLLYYKDDGYTEQEKIGIVTKSFEAEKFRNVAERLQNVVFEEKKAISQLISFKVKNNLRAYETEIEPLYHFADKKILLGKKMYELQVFLLNKMNETDYETTIKMHLS